MGRPTKDAERLAALEARFEALMASQIERHSENQAKFKELGDGLDTLQKALAKYTGFWGAIVLIGSAIATLFALVGDLLRKKMGWD